MTRRETQVLVWIAQGLSTVRYAVHQKSIEP